MSRHLGGKWWARRLAHLIPIILVLSLVLSTPVQAGGIGISGTFSGQHFQLVPGESLSAPDIYVVVFNNSDSEMRVKLTPQTPSGVELILSTVDFLLPPGSQQRIEVGVSVDLEAAPGEYILTLTAEACPEGEGIKLAGAAQMQAKLTIFGEAGRLLLSTVTTEGEPFRATVKLYRKAEGQTLPCGHSETGKLEARLTPGDYLAEAYLQDTKVAEESFTLAADEEKEITLVARTVFIAGFTVVPNYYTETGELAFAKIVYTINNLYQPLKEVKAILEVKLEGQAVEEVELISLPSLDVGQTGGSSNYVPTEGWQSGTYSFKIELYSQGKLYTQSLAQEMSAEAAEGGSTAINWPLIGGIVGGVVVIIALVMLLRRRRASS